MEHFDKVEKYLNGAMSKEELNQFEQEKQNNPAITQELNKQRVEREILKVAERDSIKRKLEELRNKHQDLPATKSANTIIKPTNRRRIFLFISAAAAILALVLFFKFITSTNQNNNSAYQLALQFDPYSDDTFKGEGNNGERTAFKAPFIEIINQGKQQEAEQAVDYFLTFSDKNNALYPNARALLGKAYLLDKDYPNAISTFREVQNSPLFQTGQKQMADYYLAVCFLLSDQRKEAQTVIQKITSTTNHRYKSRIIEFENASKQ